MIKLIIFDLDGVLVDTECIHRECLIRAVSSITGMDEDMFVHLIDRGGKTTKHKLSILKQNFGLTDLQLSLIDDSKQKNVIEHFYQPLKTLPDQDNIFRTLKNDYKLAIASNSRQENVTLLLSILGITSYFSNILSNSDVINHKPDPEIFLTVMSRENVTPSETLILEDSCSGKYAAIASGAYLFPVNDMSDVTLRNIQDVIIKINTNNSSTDGGDGDKI